MSGENDSQDSGLRNQDALKDSDVVSFVFCSVVTVEFGEWVGRCSSFPGLLEQSIMN